MWWKLWNFIVRQTKFNRMLRPTEEANMTAEYCVWTLNNLEVDNWDKFSRISNSFIVQIEVLLLFRKCLINSYFFMNSINKSWNTISAYNLASFRWKCLLYFTCIQLNSKKHSFNQCVFSIHLGIWGVIYAHLWCNCRIFFGVSVLIIDIVLSIKRG